MIYHVTNKGLNIGDIKVRIVSTSSVLLVGDVRTIQLSAAFDTPPDSVIYGPLVPVGPKS